MNENWASKPFNPLFVMLIEHYSEPILAAFLGFVDYVVEELNPNTRLFKTLQPGDLVEIVFCGPRANNITHKLLPTMSQNSEYKLYRNFPIHGMVIETEIKELHSPIITSHPRREHLAYVLVNGACVVLSDVNFYNGIYVRKIQNARL